ncbi:MAG: hypothetical protein ACYTAN_13770 [Planctomycetota bacterium]|jgi:hypothetical protein
MLSRSQAIEQISARLRESHNELDDFRRRLDGDQPALAFSECDPVAEAARITVCESALRDLESSSVHALRDCLAATGTSGALWPTYLEGSLNSRITAALTRSALHVALTSARISLALMLDGDPNAD